MEVYTEVRLYTEVRPSSFQKLTPSFHSTLLLMRCEINYWHLTRDYVVTFCYNYWAFTYLTRFILEELDHKAHPNTKKTDLAVYGADSSIFALRL